MLFSIKLNKKMKKNNKNLLKQFINVFKTSPKDELYNRTIVFSSYEAVNLRTY